MTTQEDARDRDTPERRSPGPTTGAADMSTSAPLTDSDATLIAASITDPTAFAGIFDRHWTAIHRYCASRAGASGEDIAAENLVRHRDELAARIVP